LRKEQSQRPPIPRESSGLDRRWNVRRLRGGKGYPAKKKKKKKKGEEDRDEGKTGRGVPMKEGKALRDAA